MTIDELQTMIDDYMLVLEPPPHNRSKNLLQKNRISVARQLAQLLKDNPNKSDKYPLEKLETMIRDTEYFAELMKNGESFSDIENQRAGDLENDILWIAKVLLRLMKQNSAA